MEVQRELKKKKGLLPPVLMRRVFFFCTFTHKIVFKKSCPPIHSSGNNYTQYQKKTKQTKPSHTSLKEKLIYDPDVYEGL